MSSRAMFIGCAAFATVWLNTAAASAAPALMRMQSPSQLTQYTTAIENVQYRGGTYRNGYGRNYGRDAGIGIGALIIGGIILSEAARADHRRDHRDDWQRCANTYRSFEEETGMYTGYDGVRRTCPYLN